MQAPRLLLAQLIVICDIVSGKNGSPNTWQSQTNVCTKVNNDSGLARRRPGNSAFHVPCKYIKSVELGLAQSYLIHSCLNTCNKTLKRLTRCISIAPLMEPTVKRDLREECYGCKKWFFKTRDWIGTSSLSDLLKYPLWCVVAQWTNWFRKMPLKWKLLEASLKYQSMFPWLQSFNWTVIYREKCRQYSQKYISHFHCTSGDRMDFRRSIELTHKKILSEHTKPIQYPRQTFKLSSGMKIQIHTNKLKINVLYEGRYWVFLLITQSKRISHKCVCICFRSNLLLSRSYRIYPILFH